MAMRATFMLSILGTMMVQGVAEPVLETQEDLIRFALTQGGLFIALLVVLWSYRRDFLRKEAKAVREGSELKEIVQANTAATKEQAAQSAVLNQTNARLTDSVVSLEKRLLIQRGPETK